MLVFALLGAGMTALAGAIALGIIPDHRTGGKGVVAGWVGLVFFGLCTALILWRLLTQRGALVTLSPAGIRDEHEYVALCEYIEANSRLWAEDEENPQRLSTA